MNNTNIETVNTYKEFIEQIEMIKEEALSMVLSFYKYLWKHNRNHFDVYKELILEELEGVEGFNLKPYKVTKDLNLIYRYRKEAEAVIYIKPYKVDVCIYKR